MWLKLYSATAVSFFETQCRNVQFHKCVVTLGDTVSQLIHILEVSFEASAGSSKNGGHIQEAFEILECEIMYCIIACRHKHKKHRKDHTEDEADVIITDEDSLRHGRQLVL